MTERKIGKFTVEEQPLGKGGMGVVYKAFDPMLKRHVAIKLMHGVTGGDRGSLERFYEEARTAVRLQHPNIVAVYDMGADGDDPYIVMEFIPGEDLKTLIDNRTFVPFRTKLQIISDLSVALGHAHLNEVIHRDVKPGNVRIKTDGEVKVLDFGIAKVASLDLTASGMQVGSPYYMSPEQIKGEKLDGRSDLWSVGVILYELLTFSRPFDSEDLVAIQWKIVNEPHLPLGDLLPGCCPMLTQIIDRALSKEREDRFGKGSDIVEAVNRFLEQLPAETRALESEVKSHLEQLQRFRKSPEGAAHQGVTDPALFEVVRPEGDSDDYGMLLHWNKAILECLREAERLGPFEPLHRADEQPKPAASLDKTMKSSLGATKVVKRQPSPEQALELQQGLAEKLDLAESLLEQDEAKCLELCEEVLDSDPQHAGARKLRERAQQAQERRRRLDELWVEASHQPETGRQEAPVKTGPKTLALDRDQSGPRGEREPSEERSAERDRIGRRRSRRKWVFTGVTAVALLIVVLYFALPDEVVLRIQSLMAMVQSLNDPTPDVGTDVAQLLEEAETDLRAKRFEQSARRAQVVLDLSPGNQKAQDILDEGNQALREIAEGVEEGRLLIEAGNLPAARRVLAGVLQLDPENSEAQKLLKERLTDLPTQPSGSNASMLPSGVSEAATQLTAEEAANRAAVSRLLRRLEEAYETKDVEAFTTFWPSFPESRREALEDNFRRATSIEVDFQLIDSEFSGDTGVVLANRRDRWLMQDGPGDSDTEVRIDVRKKGELWVIESLESAEKVSITVEERNR